MKLYKMVIKILRTKYSLSSFSPLSPFGRLNALPIVPLQGNGMSPLKEKILYLKCHSVLTKPQQHSVEGQKRTRNLPLNVSY